jgi:2-polyprenyl-6-methoxyphenol hydroxylase-like FAD-dependent oxidoreductase
MNKLRRLVAKTVILERNRHRSIPGGSMCNVRMIRTEPGLVSIPLEKAVYCENRWDRARGVTVIGDAAHLISPFAGEEANLAMYDGAELGEAIATNPGDIEAALLAYEKELFFRSASAAAAADRNLKLCFDDNAPQSLLDLFTVIGP